MCPCAGCVPEPQRRSFRPLGFLVNLALLYVLMVMGSGTLINTGHPVAMEACRPRRCRAAGCRPRSAHPSPC